MKKLRSYVYDIERFGMSPKKIASRLAGGCVNSPRIVTVSMPKSGTNLLQRILLLHPTLSRSLKPTLGRRNIEKWADIQSYLSGVAAGKIISSHFDFNEELAHVLRDVLNFKIVLMVRDPRDALISNMHYIQNWPGHPQKKIIGSLASDKEKLLALIRGCEGVRPIREEVLRFSNWASVAHVVRFEDVVGVAGGGSDLVQRQKISELYNFLGIELTMRDLDYMSSKSRSSVTQTFRTGAMGNWKLDFDSDLREEFDAHAGDILCLLGYQE